MADPKFETSNKKEGIYQKYLFICLCNLIQTRSKCAHKPLEIDSLAIFFLFRSICKCLTVMICNKLIFKSIYLLFQRSSNSQNLKQGTLKNFIAEIDLSSPVSFQKFKKQDLKRRISACTGMPVLGFRHRSHFAGQTHSQR